MMCHCSTPENQMHCWGWIQVVQFDAIGVRLLVMTNQIAEGDVQNSGVHELYESYDEMLLAQESFFPDGLPPRNRVQQ